MAEACIQAMDIEFTQGKIYEINSVEVNSLKTVALNNNFARISNASKDDTALSLCKLELSFR